MNRSLHKLGFYLPLNTLRNTRNQQKPFFTLILLITLGLSFIFTSSPHPLHPSSWDMATTWVPLSRVTEQSNSLAPWFQGTFGFRSVTTEAPQCLPVSHLLSSKDFSCGRDRWQVVCSSFWYTLPRLFFWGRKSQVRGVLGLVTYWRWFNKKMWLGKA